MAKKPKGGKGGKGGPPSEIRSVAENRRARHAYQILDELECGIELRGSEVKSLRDGRASIAEAFGMVKKGELWLVNAHIPEYTHGSAFNHLPTRPRKLLVHARELRAWDRRVREKGITVVPLSLYFKRHLVKVNMALVQGKKLHDKRETQKARSDRRDMDRAMSRRR